ncbi:MAG: hypothetical protein ABJF23_29380 [Bryobacteraceae bacterium]
MNTEDGLILRRRRSFVKRVICPGRHGRAAVSTGVSAWSAAEMEWTRLRSAILDALEEFPGARAAVVRALVELRDLDKGGGG